MKIIPCILIGILGVLWLSASRMNADDETRISKVEFERLWQTTASVVGVVEKYAEGKGDSLTYEYDGHLNLCSDDIAELSVTSADQKQPRKLRVSVTRKGPSELALLRRVGAKIKFSIPLLYLKYDPWGFVPSDDLKCLSARKAEDDKVKAKP